MMDTQKTKVLIVISNMEFGGAQRQIVELVNNTDKTQFEIHVCSLSNYAPLAEQFNAGISLHIIHKKAKFDFSVVFKLASLIRKHKFNIIHSYLFDAEMAARLAAKLSCTNIKVIGSERNANYTLKPIQKRAYKLTKHLVNAIIANSKSGADFNARQTGQPKSKYHVVYNGVNTNRFRPQNKKNIRAELGIEENCNLIGMFASFKQQKNHPFLISALNTLKQQGANFKLLLVGDVLHGGMHGSDTYTSAVKQQIEDSSFSNDVVYLGNRDDIEHIYPACDFTVLPSLFEGTPNVVLESMACGVPVIATDVSDNARIISHLSSGYIVETNNVQELSEKILYLLGNTATLETFSKNARQAMVNKFSSVKLAENMTKIYKMVKQK
ncbi:MAG: glycosyltransferase involved in cell wall biosynthesis [Psychromonas sp.]|jgi:glycosyltransferase involved in cell wall biosynthesis|uniref:glycosyltransferase n=1 Tax=Psychromonas sp. TaxID=1884585 RepID=UPI0039E5B5DF